MKYYIQKSGEKEQEISYIDGIAEIKKQGISEDIACVFLNDTGCAAFDNFCIWSETGEREEWEGYLKIIENIEKNLTKD